jgi:hypothetical protein
VLTAGDPPLPVGKIDAVLHARAGDQLVIERAYQPGRFTSLPATQVIKTTDVPAGARWHEVDVDAAHLAQLPVYRRVLGRLTGDPVRLLPAAPPDDAAARQALLQAMREDPLTAGADLQVHVRHGVVFLSGTIASVGAKVIAERLARTTPGIWDARNSVISDEELSAVARSRALADPHLASVVEEIKVEGGGLYLRLRSTAGPEALRAAVALIKLPGCNAMRIARSADAAPDVGATVGGHGGEAHI